MGICQFWWRVDWEPQKIIVPSLSPVLNIQLHLAGELLLVPAQPAEGGVCPAVEPLVDQPAGGLRDGEDEEGQHHLNQTGPLQLRDSDVADAIKTQLKAPKSCQCLSTYHT